MTIPTWYHAVQTLDVILCDPTFCADLVNKSGDEAHDSICNIIVLWVLKPTLSVITLCNTACNAKGTNKSSNKCEQFSWGCTCDTWTDTDKLCGFLLVTIHKPCRKVVPQLHHTFIAKTSWMMTLDNFLSMSPAHIGPEEIKHLFESELYVFPS